MKLLATRSHSAVTHIPANTARQARLLCAPWNGRRWRGLPVRYVTLTRAAPTCLGCRALLAAGREEAVALDRRLSRVEPPTARRGALEWLRSMYGADELMQLASEADGFGMTRTAWIRWAVLVELLEEAAA